MHGHILEDAAAALDVPIWPKAAESATLEAASSSSRGSGWAPNGLSSAPGRAEPPEPATRALRSVAPSGAAGAGGTLAMLTYSKGGGAGSRLQSLTVTTSPISPDTIDCLTRLKLGSKRRCSAVISFTPASLQALIASMVSVRSVAIGFSVEHTTHDSVSTRVHTAHRT
jgi:hypothetical protein